MRMTHTAQLRGERVELPAAPSLAATEVLSVFLRYHTPGSPVTLVLVLSENVASGLSDCLLSASFSGPSYYDKQVKHACVKK